MNIEILVGSTLGGTEYLAEAVQPYLEEVGITSNIHFNPDLNSLPPIVDKQIWLICLSTHGAGDYPENFKTFVEQIKQTTGSLSKLSFGLIGIGDSNYDTFCFAAKHFDELLLEKEATRLGDVFNIDVINSPIPEDRLVDWIPLWIKDLTNLDN